MTSLSEYRIISAGSCSGSDYIVGVAGSGPVRLHCKPTCLTDMHKNQKISPNSFSTSSWVWVALSPGSFPLPVAQIGHLQSDCRAKSCGGVTNISQSKTNKKL